MRFRFPFSLCVFFILCGFSSPAAALDREAFTVTKYDLEIRLEPEQQRLGARGKIVLRNESAQPQKVVALQISSSLSWRAIRAADKALQFVSQPYTSDIDHTGSLSEAIVTLPAEVKPKDSVELEVGYEGVIPLDATRLARVGVPDAIARHTSWDHIGVSFTAVRGAGYVAWYPITTESADFSEGNSLFEVVDRWKARAAGGEFKLTLTSRDTADSTPILLCGTEASKTAADAKAGSGSEREIRAECDWNPIGTAVPMFAMADYQDYSKLRWFRKPDAPIAIADFVDPHAAPFESGTLLMVSMEDGDTKQAGINLVHELVHSAFTSARPWVHEGLAHFAEAAYREQQGGRSAALDLLAAHRAAFLDAEKDVPGAQIRGGVCVVDVARYDRRRGAEGGDCEVSSGG
jgi:hypothetical protein